MNRAAQGTDVSRAERKAAATLAAFPAMTTRRLWALRGCGSWQRGLAVASGHELPSPTVAAMLARTATLGERWARHARSGAVSRVFERCVEHGIDVVVPASQDYPAQLRDDPAPPALLFVRGRLSALDARRVAIIGTRNATQRGRENAARFGFELAQHGVSVVSGLARGIDAAAHSGALTALRESSQSSGGDVGSDVGVPIAVVANGLDSPYPRANSALWERVAANGLLISEWPPGTRPDAWRFPLRNRILAALSEVLVVVESRESGGSLITANDAARRGVDVFAVPGPITARSAAGTNELLRDGAAPALNTEDLLLALGLDQSRAGRRRSDRRPLPTRSDAAALEVVRRSPTHLGNLATELDVALTDAALSLARLECNGWVREVGGWFEAVGEWDEVDR